jgi:hypothetical protein
MVPTKPARHDKASAAGELTHNVLTGCMIATNHTTVIDARHMAEPHARTNERHSTPDAFPVVNGCNLFVFRVLNSFFSECQTIFENALIVELIRYLPYALTSNPNLSTNILKGCRWVAPYKM